TSSVYREPRQLSKGSRKESPIRRGRGAAVDRRRLSGTSPERLRLPLVLKRQGSLLTIMDRARSVDSQAMANVTFAIVRAQAESHYGVSGPKCASANRQASRETPPGSHRPPWR